MTIKQFREKRAGVVASMRSLVEASEAPGGTFDQDAFKALETEAGQLAAQIEGQERLASLEAELAAPLPAVSAGQGLSGVEVIQDEADKGFATLGEFAVAAHLNPTDRRLIQYGVSAEQRMDTGSAGGFAVPKQFLPEVMAVQPAATPLMSLVRELPAGSPPDAEVTFPALDQTGAAPGHQFGGVTVAWTAEGGTKNETEGELREVSVKPEEVSGYVQITDKLLRNWAAAAAWLDGLLGAALRAGIEDSLHTGNGIGKPLGFHNSAAVVAVNRTTANTVTYADVCDMFGLAMTAGGMKAWLANPSLLSELMQMVTTAGYLVWQPNAREGSPGSLLGVPVFLDEFAPALGTKGDLSLVQGQNYITKPGSGPFVETGKSGDDFEKNKSKVKIFTNIGGQSWLTAPYKRRDGVETSAFVVLDVV